MQTKSVRGVVAGIVVGSIGIALALTATARSADSLPARGASDIPQGYLLVKQDELRKIVHDEVSRQLQEFFRQVQAEQQRKQAAARFHVAGEMAMMLRSQLALYRLQHNDNNPTLKQVEDGFWLLTVQTDANGRPSTDRYTFGPYLQHKAVNPATGKSKVALAGKVTTDAGWTYDPTTGYVRAVFPKSLEAQVKAELTPRDAEIATAN